MDLKTDLNTLDYLTQISQRLDGADLFYGHGTDNAWDEACWLVQGVLRMSTLPGTDPLPLSAELVLDAAQVAMVEDLLAQRIATRKPLAYLLHEGWFAGHCFYVDERVLVPRSPIAELIEHRFTSLLPRPPACILDLCTGSGCIGIACALAFPEATVVLSDLSPDALAVAAINIERFGVGDRVSTVESDLFQAIDGRFDLIVSNPPYVSREEYRELPQEYHREPAMGLLTEDEGLEIPSMILHQAADYLRDDGTLLLEVGYNWPLLAERFPQLPFLWLEFEYGGEGICALRRPQLPH